MRKLLLFSGLFLVMGLIIVCGCGDGNSSDSDDGEPTMKTPDVVISLRVDDTTGFVVMVDTATDTAVTNTYGAEIYPGTGCYGYNGYVYTTGSMANDKVAKYALREDSSLEKVAEVVVYESGGAIATNLIFLDDTKMYLLMPGAGELLVMSPQDLTIIKRIDLSPYAIDENGETGGNDINPEPSSGVIRDGKLYVSLAQIDSFQGYQGRPIASLLIIDAGTDEILKHITDDRASTAGEIDPNSGLILDENNDIYVSCTASFGYWPGMTAGFLRIKNGEDEFDPDYFLSITDLTDLDVPGGVATYAYHKCYLDNGRLYTTLFIPGLTSNPPDYVNDRNYQPYMVDLHNRTVTKLDMPATIGWSTSVTNLNGDIIYGLSTENGTGLYRLNESTPFITTQGNPFVVTAYE